MHEMMEATKQRAKPDWLGKNVDFYIKEYFRKKRRNKWV
jgi:hypothetical protein